MMNDASEFVEALKNCETHHTLYVMGCFGAPLNSQTKQRYIDAESYNSRPDREALILDASPDTFGFDCVCLIKGILWGWCGDVNDCYGGADYLTDLVPDLDADQMISVCEDCSEDFSAILPGEAVWLPGHIGVYVGNGLVIECTPRWKNCVQYSACLNIAGKDGYPGREWVRHGKLPYLTYDTADVPEEDPAIPAPQPPLHKPEQEEKRYQTLSDLPKWAQAPLNAYLHHGSLTGTGTGLNLSEDMVRLLVVMQRELQYYQNENPSSKN